MRKPDTFILGAPKCGTTALSEYLREHPQVFFSTPKEPNFFAPDLVMPGREDWRFARSEEAYLDLFRGATDAHRVVAEGSTWYLASREAVPRILRLNPGARLIVMLRNPLEMVPSLHAQALYDYNESVESLEEAWRLQPARAQGRELPRSCRNPLSLQYGMLAHLGEQLARVLDQAPREQVQIIVYDDFARDPARVYRETLRFLRLPDDGRASFPRVNTHKAYRSMAFRSLEYWLRTPPPTVRAVKEAAKRALGVETLGVHRTVATLNWGANLSREPRRPPSQEFLAELREVFRDDVEQLSDLLGRDLSHWLAV